jgi:threonine/homoserine/homoserine lactone efflux protein
VPDGSTYALFVAAAVALAVVPGPAVLYVVAQGVGGGRLAGVVSAAGIGVGGLVHTAAATVGLSALLVSSATAFTVVRYAGAAYLVLLGAYTLLRRPAAERAVAPAHDRLRRLFVQGVVVNVLNPKTALFFLAFLPQFVDPAAGAPAVQTALLGSTFVAVALMSDSAYAVAAGSAASLVRRAPGVLRARRYLSGGVLVGLGLATALSGSKQRA